MAARSLVPVATQTAISARQLVGKEFHFNQLKYLSLKVVAMADLMVSKQLAFLNTSSISSFASSQDIEILPVERSLLSVRLEESMT